MTMYEERQIGFSEAKDLLVRCGLHPVDRADYRCGIFDSEDELLATGALVGDMLQMIAVDPACQGEDLSVRVVTHLVGEAARRGIFCLHLFTKSGSVRFFEGIGFRTVAHVPGEVALLEWGQPGIREYCRALEGYRDPEAVRVGALVMNANPFTAGHRFLAETAAAACDRVFLLAVEEDLSEFPFSVRLELIRQGTADLDNLTVIPGGRYVISSLTFPAYFSRDAARARQQSRIDAEIFVKHIVPALGITDRFLGEEPFSPSTAVYNEVVKERLEAGGVAVHVLPRTAVSGQAVSASEVRRLIAEGKTDEALHLLPETTAAYVKDHERQIREWISRKR